MKYFILSLLFAIQFNVLAQNSDLSIVPDDLRFNTMNAEFEDIDNTYLLVPATQIIKPGYIKREGLKGIIFTDITHHSIFASKVRKQIFSLFEKSPYYTNKKKWKTKDGYSKDNIYVSINSSYIDEYQDFNAYWIFKDHNQKLILSFKATNKDFQLVLNELKLIEQK